MDPFDYNNQLKTPRNFFGFIWNILTVLVVIGVACVACSFLVLFTNPYSAFNPFPPPTTAVALSLPTETPTSFVILPPTWTPTFTLPPTETFTPVPTSTLPPTPTPITFTPTTAPTATIPPGGYAYVLRQGSPKAIPNIYHPELGCNWMGVGGQAVDMSGGPVTGLIIQLGGVLPGVRIQENLMSLTGVALDYGRAGYEFTLADHPIASRGLLWVQLLDQIGSPLSEKVYFDTYDSCDKNLIIIDFRLVR